MHRMCHLFNMLVAVVAVSTGPAVKTAAAQQTARDKQVQIVAEEMCCKGCARKISGQLYAARGVRNVEIDMNTKLVSVSLAPQKSASLGQLWQAVEQGEGGPTKLITAEATYTLTPPATQANAAQPLQYANGALQIVVDNLHCMGCAKKIGAQLYALKGVTKVSADLQKDTLTVETRSRTPLSPWQVIGAVMKAKERPLLVTGIHGTLSIEWATKSTPKNHHQAQQTINGGIQR